MAVNKLDPKIIFASEAPAQDVPAVFTNKTVGWGESRKNGGRPTIKQSNALQQETDLKILWLNENAVTPYDASIDYPTNAVTIKDGAFKIFNGSVWNTFLTKSSVGLGNVDNTSDLNKPISTDTQSALNGKAAKTYVDTNLALKADLSVVKRGIGNIYDPTLTYNENERVILLNGDVVKSTISNNTNNPNTNMTGWSIGLPTRLISDDSGLNQQEINDKLEISAPIVSSNFNSIQAAIDESINGSEIFVSSGSHTESVSLNKSTVSGVGYSSVINVEPNSYGFKVLQNLPNWDRTKLENMTITGIVKDNNVGVLFDPDDAVSGRKSLSFLSISNLDIAIKKPRGSIGNTYENMNIYECNYGIKANSVFIPQEMHSGNDTWRDFQIDTIAVYAFDYFDDTGGGAIHIKDGIIEYCDGGGIRLEYNDRYPPFIPPRISNVWFEQVAKASKVTRDGVDEIPRAIKLVNTAMCIIENCKLDNIELVNSSALAINCRVDSTKMVIDDNSNLIVENAFLNGSVPKNVTVSSIATQSYPTHFGANLTLRGGDIVSVERTPVSASAAVGVTYTGNVGKLWAVDGSALIYAESVIDTNGTQCARLNLTASTVNVLPYITTPSDHWVVWGISAKQVGALSGSFKFNMDYNLGDIILEEGKWVNSFGIAKSPAADMNIRANLSPTTNGTILIKDYFIASFKKESDAVAFVNSRTSINTYPEVVYKNYSPPIIPANGSVQTNIDFLGVSLVDNIVSSFNKPLSGVEVTSYVTSQNVVTVVFRNPTSTGITLPSGTISSKLV